MDQFVWTVLEIMVGRFGHTVGDACDYVTRVKGKYKRVKCVQRDCIEHLKTLKSRDSPFKGSI